MISAVIVGAAEAQSANTRTRVDDEPNFYSTPQPGPTGCQQTNAGTTTASASTACSPIPGGFGSATAAFTGGVLRSDARILANNAVLAPVGSTGDQLVVAGRVDYADRVTIVAPTGLIPTNYRFSLEWSGTLIEPVALAPGVLAFVQGALLFQGSGGPATPIGWTGITRWFSAFPTVVQEFGGSYTGAFSQRIENGSRITTIAGISSFNGLLTSNTLNFGFTHYSDAILTNTSALGQIVNGELRADFTRSARIADLRVFDNERDITDQVQLQFASGYALPTVVPEPSTLSLLLVGVALAGGLAHRRRRGRSTSVAADL